MVAISDRFGEALQHHDARTAAETRSSCPGVKGAAAPVGRNHPSLLIEVTPLLRKSDRYCSGERHIALVVQQALAGLADRDERSRAGGLDSNARSLQIEFVGDTRRKKIFIVPEHRGVTAHLV